MIVYRIAKTEYSRDLSGEGARLYGGRWNSPGQACLYTSDSSALALLEVAVHHTNGLFPSDIQLIRIEIPDFIVPVDQLVSYLPDGWDNAAGSAETRHIGDQWLGRKDALIMRVPSVVVEYSFNLLINPHHPDFSSVSVRDTIPVEMDDRIF